MSWPPRNWVALEGNTAAKMNSIRDALNLLASSTSTITTTGNQAALALPSGRGPLVIFANNGSQLTLQGITAGYDGQSLYVFSKGAAAVDLTNQDAAASAALRIINRVSCNRTLSPGKGWIHLIYDATTTRWRVASHDQGDWQTRTFNSAHYSTTGGGTWTVASGNVVSFKSWLHDTTLKVAWKIRQTTTAGTPTQLNITMPNSCQAATELDGQTHHWTDSAGGTNGAGTVSTTVGGTSLNLSKDSAEAFPNGFINVTATFWTRGQVNVDVQ